MLYSRFFKKLFPIFGKIIFNKSAFLTNIYIPNMKYEHYKNQNNKLWYSFNNELHYILIYSFRKLEILKCNIDKFFTNLLIKFITKKAYITK